MQLTTEWSAVVVEWCPEYWPTWNCRQSWRWSRCAAGPPRRLRWSDAPARGHAPPVPCGRRRRSPGGRATPGCSGPGQTCPASRGWWWPGGKGHFETIIKTAGTAEKKKRILHNRHAILIWRIQEKLPQFFFSLYFVQCAWTIIYWDYFESLLHCWRWLH